MEPRTTRILELHAARSRYSRAWSLISLSACVLLSTAACLLFAPQPAVDPTQPPAAQVPDFTRPPGLNQSPAPTLNPTPPLLPEPAQTAAPDDYPPAGRWQPALKSGAPLRWQWQLSGLPVDTSVSAGVYDIDLFDNDPAVVRRLHEAGRRVICYLSAGSWEDWRPDAARFPAEVIGADYSGWPGEHWLDIRRIDALLPALLARLDLCRSSGFDAVEPDNIDGYQNETGFPLSAADQLAFNRWLSAEAHARGLAVGLKNDPEQAAALQPDFDFAITESCFAEGWCEQLRPFLDAGKPVFAAEYTDTGIRLEDFCPQAQALGISAILKDRELDAGRQACPGD